MLTRQAASSKPKTDDPVVRGRVEVVNGEIHFICPGTIKGSEIREKVYGPDHKKAGQKYYLVVVNFGSPRDRTPFIVDFEDNGQAGVATFGTTNVNLTGLQFDKA